MSKIAKCIPKNAKHLTQYSGEEILDKIGIETIKDLVGAILTGANVRSLTEALTRKRIALSNAALLTTYLNASASIEDFTDKLPSIVTEELLNSKLNKIEKSYLHWLVGLTEKSIQNVLRSDTVELNNYLNNLEKGLTDVSLQTTALFGDLTGNISIEERTLTLSWTTLINIFMAIGAQTLAIRGSEKSLYGKLFEKLILGSMLTVLGFSLVDKSDNSKNENIFWLSERGEKRESDATALIKPGIGVRFDIGFIGPGNTEISLDKVSRFEREMEFGRQKHYMSTIILVDKIGDKSRVVELAKQINGTIIQMRMSHWVIDVAKTLNRDVGFLHPILDMNDEDAFLFIEKSVKNTDLKTFI